MESVADLKYPYITSFGECKTKKRSSLELLFVIRLGLEPRTPTLKVLCSTC